MSFLRSPSHIQASNFWNDIKLINEAVARRVIEPGAQLWNIPLKVREDIEGYHAMIGRIMAFTIELLELPRMSGSGKAEGMRGAALQQFLLNCDLVLGELEHRKLGEKERRNRSDELLMENLTAAWLGLYFLGVPFVHPWEKVRRLAVYRGGFPSGGCIAKYIGDVYRLARHRVALPDLPVARPSSCSQLDDINASAVLVLSHTPMVLLEDALTYRNDTYATPLSVHELGRRYALLQMMLYIRCGHPVHFLIPATALKQALHKLAGIPDDPGAIPTEAMLRRRVAIRSKIRTWLHETIFTSIAAGQSVRLLKFPLDASGMPTCVLGSKTGIYTLESGSEGLHFAGNELRDSLLGSYRDKLLGVLKLSNVVPAASQAGPRAVSLLDAGKVDEALKDV